MTRAVFGRIFLIALLLTGATAVTLFVTRTGYNVARTPGPGAGSVTCVYWLGFGLHGVRHDLGGAAEAHAFECPLLVRDVGF